MSHDATARPRFYPGQVVATPEGLEAMEASGRSLDGFLNRNRLGDWGDLDDGDRELNDQARLDGFRLLSAYSTV